MAKQTKKVIKKTTAKKPAVKTVKKVAAKPVVEAQKPCECGCGCGCGCHKHAGHVLKKIIVLALVFALGMFAGKALHFGGSRHFHPMFHPVFTNGCLDLTSIKCPKMQEDILKADVNADGCISVEEFKAAKSQHKPRHMKKGDMPFKPHHKAQ